MKKIDLHIHTVPTFSDSHFKFSLDAFKKYVDEAKLDAVAVTNHDMFDVAQFKEIQKYLGIIVFPGIEINVEEGHVLIIGCASKLEEFSIKSKSVEERIRKIGDKLTAEELLEIYGRLDEYLVIPHLDKSPPIAGNTLKTLLPYCCAGEVDSAKKFIRAVKDGSKLTPVLFSDLRIREDLSVLPTRQTFIDCGDITIDAIKTCLRDKQKVSLSRDDGNDLWQVFDSGEKISTGLNVVIGARSTGKTYTLDRLCGSIENVKYIKQFMLVQQDEAASDKSFNGDVERRRSAISDEYLYGLKVVLDDLMKVDLTANERAVERYVTSLVKSAEEADRQDTFSKATLFNEEPFPIVQTKPLQELIASVRHIIENGDFRNIIDKHVDISAMKKLCCELIELLWEKSLDGRKKGLANEVLIDIKHNLRLRTSAVSIEDVDLYKVSLDRFRVNRFNEIVSFLKREGVVFEEEVQNYRIEARKTAFSSATDVKSAIRVKTSLKNAFDKYDDAYEYLRELMADENIARADLYRLFVKISYRILNKDGCEVSGGERSEFRLLQEISDAQNYDILLIDEPESSFDNLFLNGNVNQILKDIAKTMPVVVVTHNSTVGASVDPNYILYTNKVVSKGEVKFRIYYGHPTDKQLTSADGDKISTHEVLLNSLEAGKMPYESRRIGYEAIKN